MGGEDWKLWMQALKDADVLSEDASTVAYSYIGSELTYPIYFEGTIGAAKKHLHQTADEITKEVGVKALISVNKGLGNTGKCCDSYCSIVYVCII